MNELHNIDETVTLSKKKKLNTKSKFFNDAGNDFFAACFWRKQI